MPYSESGDKDWISATVTIDGSTLENVGLRLKGNSSLQALSGKGGGPQGAGAAAAKEATASAHATAPADATAPGSSGDGAGTAESPETLPWLIRTDKFVQGQLYQGRTDLVIRGNDTEDYMDVFEQKTGADDLEPVIKFLDFINNASDEDFTAHLDEYLDVEAFATYLAVQDLLTEQAADLVPTETVEKEAADIAKFLTAEAS